MLETVTGGATIAATSGFDQVPRCTAMVVAAQSTWAMRASIGWGRHPIQRRSSEESRVSVEDRTDVPGALQLEETGRARDEHHAIPELARRLTLGRRGDDRSEERDLLPRDRAGRVNHRGADVGTDRLHPGVVAGH